MGKRKKNWRIRGIHRRAQREAHKSNPQTQKVSREHVQEIRQYLSQYKKKHRCEHCNESHPACLGFHHREKSQKLFCIAEAPRLGYNLDAIIKEIAKCDILCHNCHAKLHYDE